MMLPFGWQHSLLGAAFPGNPAFLTVSLLGLPQTPLGFPRSTRSDEERRKVNQKCHFWFTWLRLKDEKRGKACASGFADIFFLGRFTWLFMIQMRLGWVPSIRRKQ